MNLKNPFRLVAENKDQNRHDAHEKILAIYNREKDKALKLYGNYSVKKINWLYKKATEAQEQIDKILK